MSLHDARPTARHGGRDITRAERWYGPRRPNSPVVAWNGDVVSREPGKFHETGKQQIDYLLMSPAISAAAKNAGIERGGHYARNTWKAFDTVTSARFEASDHHAVWVVLAVSRNAVCGLGRYLTCRTTYAGRKTRPRSTEWGSTGAIRTHGKGETGPRTNVPYQWFVDLLIEQGKVARLREPLVERDSGSFGATGLMRAACARIRHRLSLRDTHLPRNLRCS